MISMYYARRLLEKGVREMKGCNIKEFPRGAVLTNTGAGESKDVLRLVLTSA